MTELQKYLQLLSLVITGLPTDAVNNAVREGYEANISVLNSVRTSQMTNLEHLVALISYVLPKYKISAELQPAPVSQTLFG